MDIEQLASRPSQSLLQAVASGSVQGALKLLADGVDLDEAGPNGNTSLHEAVRLGHHSLAAHLLAKGADWRIRNLEGRRPLDLAFADLDSLHRIRQEYHRLPVAAYSECTPDDSGIASLVAAIERDGFAHLEGFVQPDELERLQNDFGRFVRRLRLARLFRRKIFRHYDESEHWRPGHRSYVTNDALRYSPALAEICCDPMTVETVSHYLGKPAHIKRVQGMRYLPSEPLGGQQFRWHHDMEDRQLKVMILLTDVGDDDQYMSYVRGSHAGFHPYSCFLQNELEFDYVKSYTGETEIVRLTGRAGDLFFFDSNGMHRGNRSRGRVRDALFVEFTADRNRNNVWGTEVDRNRIDSRHLRDGDPIQPLLAATPKWKRAEKRPPRGRPSWAESLEDPESWL